VSHPTIVIGMVEAAYLAGLLDGEGHISVNRTRTGPSAKACKRGYAYRSQIMLTMTDEKLVRWVHALTGLGTVAALRQTNSRHRPAWRWTVWSREASTVARAILPYLRLKKPQAEALIGFQAVIRVAGTRGLTDAEWAAREVVYTAFREMNRRGLAA
jgi:hypothetical protein